MADEYTEDRIKAEWTSNRAGDHQRMVHHNELDLPSRLNASHIITILALILYVIYTILMGLEVLGYTIASINAWVWMFGGFAIAHIFWAMSHLYYRMQDYDLHPHHIFNVERSFWLSLAASIVMLSLIIAFQRQWNNIGLSVSGAFIPILSLFRNETFWGPYFSLGAQSVTLMDRILSRWMVIMGIGVVIFFPLVMVYAESVMFHIVRQTTPWFETGDPNDIHKETGSYAASTTRKRKGRSKEPSGTSRRVHGHVMPKA